MITIRIGITMMILLGAPNLAAAQNAPAGQGKPAPQPMLKIDPQSLGRPIIAPAAKPPQLPAAGLTLDPARTGVVRDANEARDLAEAVKAADELRKRLPLEGVPTDPWEGKPWQIPGTAGNTKESQGAASKQPADRLTNFPGPGSPPVPGIGGVLPGPSAARDGTQPGAPGEVVKVPGTETVGGRTLATTTTTEYDSSGNTTRTKTARDAGGALVYSVTVRTTPVSVETVIKTSGGFVMGSRERINAFGEHAQTSQIRDADGELAYSSTLTPPQGPPERVVRCRGCQSGDPDGPPSADAKALAAWFCARPPTKPNCAPMQHALNVPGPGGRPPTEGTASVQGPTIDLRKQIVVNPAPETVGGGAAPPLSRTQDLGKRDRPGPCAPAREGVPSC